MTLIVAVLPKSQSAWIVASDRRLTSNGELVDENFNKAIYAANHHFNSHIAFTGLARASHWNTQNFLEEEPERLNRLYLRPDEFTDQLCKALNEQASRMCCNFLITDDMARYL